jgi:hypothetical protein
MCRAQARRYRFLLSPHGQRQDQCDAEHEDGYDRSTTHRRLPSAGITATMCGHSNTGSMRFLIPVQTCVPCV